MKIDYEHKIIQEGNLVTVTPTTIKIGGLEVRSRTPLTLFGWLERLDELRFESPTAFAFSIVHMRIAVLKMLETCDEPDTRAIITLKSKS